MAIMEKAIAGDKNSNKIRTFTWGGFLGPTHLF
jgi:hypothetical protein